jgi:hypothetical protein
MAAKNSSVSKSSVCLLLFCLVSTTCLAQAARDLAWQVSVNADRDGVHIRDQKGGTQDLPTAPAMLGAVHMLPDGASALVASRTGWVFRLDLAQGKVLTRVQVAQRINGTALSVPPPGQSALLAIANEWPHTLVILDSELQAVRELPAVDPSGRLSSPLLAVRVAASRSSFIVGLKHLPELWEVSYNPKAPEIALGMVHDFQYREGSFVPGYLNPQRIVLATPALDFWLSSQGDEALSLHDNSETHDGSGHRRVSVTHLDVRRQVGELRLPEQLLPKHLP